MCILKLFNAINPLYFFVSYLFYCFVKFFYIDEIPLIIQEYTELNKVENKDETVVGAEDF